jgi:hypothetical protein
MAFEAEYGVSTVLEALCVASTVRLPIPGERRGSSKSPAPQGRSGAFVGHASRVQGVVDRKFKIRNLNPQEFLGGTF